MSATDEDQAAAYRRGWEAALASVRHELARAWDEGREGAIADHRPPMTGFAPRANPFRSGGSA